jgi:hypothetical protein
MLQNRVDPSGNIIKTPARGAWLGNRGVIHNAHQQMIRPFKLKAWITCRLEFKGKKRKVMTPDRWTELFFLDEATAFAAGHRPCFECRREDAVRFKQYWLKGNPEYGFNEKTPIGEIDKVLHKERIGRDHSKITFPSAARDLPKGAFVLYKNDPYLVSDGTMFLWSPAGYAKGIAFPDEQIPVLTPRSVVQTFRAGYVPGIAGF